MSAQFATVEVAIDAIRHGKVILVVDAEDRENEGDFICAAEKVTPEIVNFMITMGRGQLCMPILPDLAERLKLPLMVESNTTPLGTSYTVPVDHRTSRTGITAQERATTILEILNPHSVPGDFVRPGHLFPLIAKEGGVLRRAGHTEAGVDLARMADLAPAGFFVKSSTPMVTARTASSFSQSPRTYDMPIITIEDLIRYRRVRRN